MTMTQGFKRAERTAVKLKLLVMGPSGAGKTLGSLKIAAALYPGKVAVIDSENDRSSYYADEVAFDALSISDHRPSAYQDAIKLAIESGYQIVVIDSLTHAWQNVLDRKEAYDRANPKSNGYTNWKTFGAEWDKLIRFILDAPIHIIATSRSKQSYEQTTDENGKKQIKKMGMAPQVRDGAEYEFAVVFDVMLSHRAEATKDNTGLFDGDQTRLWDLCSGEVPKALASWLSTAKPAAPKMRPEDLTHDTAQSLVVRGVMLGTLDADRLTKCLEWAKSHGDAMAERACTLLLADLAFRAAQDPSVALAEAA